MLMGDYDSAQLVDGIYILGCERDAALIEFHIGCQAARQPAFLAAENEDLVMQ